MWLLTLDIMKRQYINNLINFKMMVEQADKTIAMRVEGVEV
jgi:hypothetical protein